MSAEIDKIIQSPDGRERMLQIGLPATGTTPEEFGEVIRKAGIRPERSMAFRLRWSRVP